MSNTARGLLEALKATEVRQLAFLAGLDSSATKTQLVDRLPHLLSTPRFVNVPLHDKKTLRVLSIDMGIRNLAYCVLDVPVSALTTTTRDDGGHARKSTPTPAATSSKKKPSSPFNVFSASIPAPSPTTTPSILNSLTLSAWQRTSITPESLNLSPSSTDTTTPAQTAPPISSTTPSKTTKPPQEAFDPPLFARLAYALVRNVLLPHAPDVIIIERQRYRSAGSPAILEWTVRVNMFESMLHSVFETLKREHRGEEGVGFPDVWPVNPKKVTGFWTGGGDSDDGAGEVEVEGDGGVVTDVELQGGTEVEIALVGRVPKKKKQTKKREVRKAKEIKEVKIAIAEKWLRGAAQVGGTDGGSGGLKCAAAARGTRGAFLDARGRKKGRAGGGDAAVFDDGDIDVDGDGDVNVDVDGDVEGIGLSENGDVRAADGLEGMQNTVDDNNNKNKKPAKLSKLDDLADCLLQGVAWIQWEVNRRRILEVLNQKGQGEDLR